MEEDSPRLSSEGGKKKIPIGIILFLGLLLMVGFQTLQLNKLTSFTLNSFSDTTNEAIAISETISNQVSEEELPRFISLSELTEGHAPKLSNCEKGFQRIDNKVLSPQQRQNITTQKIPFYIHQTSKSRCIPNEFTKSINSWRNIYQYDYYLHDDAALWRLLDREWPEFPHLHAVVRCLKSMTALSDVWRLVVLWEYGGIYADLDSETRSWTPSSIKPDDDSYFVVENYDAPSQYFMVAAPRHPLIFYAINQALLKIMNVENTQILDASMTTGPFALLDGFTWFMNDVGQNVGKPVRQGTYHGRYNRTVRIDGYGRKRSDEIIKREATVRGAKSRAYAKMNMTHFFDDQKKGRQSSEMGRSCFSITYDILIGPPEWFVAPDNEDRETLGGVS